MAARAQVIAGFRVSKKGNKSGDDGRSSGTPDAQPGRGSRAAEQSDGNAAAEATKVAAEAVAATAEEHPALQEVVPPGTAGQRALDTAELDPALPKVADLSAQVGAPHPPPWAISTPSTSGAEEHPSSSGPGSTAQAGSTGAGQPAGSVAADKAWGSSKGLDAAEAHGEVDATSEEMRESAGVDDAHLAGRVPPRSPSPLPEVPQDPAATASAMQEGDEDDALYDAQVAGLAARGDKAPEQGQGPQQGAQQGQQPQQGRQSAGARVEAVLHEMAADLRDDDQPGGDRGLDWQLLQDRGRTADPKLSAAMAWPHDPLKHERELHAREQPRDGGGSAEGGDSASSSHKADEASPAQAGSDPVVDTGTQPKPYKPRDLPADAVPERVSDPGLDDVTSATDDPQRSKEHGEVQDGIRQQHRHRQLELAVRELEEEVKEELQHRHEPHHAAPGPHGGRGSHTRAEAEAEVQELVHHPDEVIAEMQHEAWGGNVFPEYVHAVADAAALAETEERRGEHSPEVEDAQVAAAREEALSAFRAKGYDSSSFLDSLNSPRVRSQSPAEVDAAALAQQAARTEQPAAAGATGERAAMKPAEQQGEGKDEEGDKGESEEPLPLDEALAAAAASLQQQQEEALQAGQGQVSPAESSSLLAGVQPRVSPQELAGEARRMLLEAMSEEVRAVRVDMKHVTRLLKDMKKALLFVEQHASRLPSEDAQALQQSILQEMARLEVEASSADAGMTALALAMSHLQRGGAVPALHSVEQYMQYIEGMAETLAEAVPGVAAPNGRPAATTEHGPSSAAQGHQAEDGSAGHEEEGGAEQGRRRAPLAVALLVQGAEVLRDEVEASLKSGNRPADEDSTAAEARPKHSRLGRRLLAAARKRFGGLVHHSSSSTELEGPGVDTAAALQLGLVPRKEDERAAAGQGTEGGQGDGAKAAAASATGAADKAAAGSNAQQQAKPASASATPGAGSTSGEGHGASSSSPAASSGAANNAGADGAGAGSFKAAASKPPVGGGGGGGGGGGARPPRPTAQGAGGDGGDRPASPWVSWLLVTCCTLGLAAGCLHAARHLSFGNTTIGPRHTDATVAMVPAEPVEAAAAEAAAAQLAELAGDNLAEQQDQGVDEDAAAEQQPKSH